jgi:glycosyltransferase involved in cell wall biosynthesis
MKMTMLHWTDPMEPATGGIDTFIQGLIRYAPSDVTLDVVGVTADPATRPPCRWHSVQLGDTRFRLFPLFAIQDRWTRSRCPHSLRFTAMLFCRRATFSADIFLAHAIEPLLALRSATAIATVMHLDPDEMLAQSSGSRWRRVPGIYRMVEKLALSRASRIYTVRDNVRQRYERSGLAAPVFFTPTGVDVATFTLSTPEARRAARTRLAVQLGLPAATVIAVSVGRLEAQKGYSLLLDALNLARGAPLHLLLIGDGRLRERLEQKIAAENLSDRVTMLGALAPEQIAAVHHGADVYVMPSLYEGMSIALLEAQACGLPVIAAAVGEAGRTITHARTGILVRHRTAPDFARALMEFTEHRETFSRHSCAAEVERFTASNVAGALHSDLRCSLESQLRDAIA